LVKRGGKGRGGSSLSSLLVEVSYSLFKGLAERWEPRLKALKAAYDLAGYALHFRAYLSLMFFSALLAAALAFSASFLIHYAALGYAPWLSAALSSTLSFAASMSTLAGYVAAPLYRARRWRGLIEAALPHTANYMLALASAGIPIEAVFEGVAEANINPALTSLCRRVVRGVKLFGMDALAALEEAAGVSPSPALTKLIRGLLGVVSTSGDVRSFLAVEADALLRSQRDRLRRVVGTLTLLAEAYIGIVVVAPLVLVIMALIFSMLGGTILGLGPDVLMMAVILVGIPVLSAIFLLILDSVLAGA
jgi:archaellum biogenesis protein FlaJ (TadC family)